MNPTARNTNPMQPAQARKLLLARQAELEQDLRSRRTSLHVEPEADPVDGWQSASQRDFEVGRLNHGGYEMSRVRQALEAIEKGNYGICVDCEEPIGEKRLQAMPWAERCVSCQHRFENSWATASTESAGPGSSVFAA